jgi:hypothetical protein
MRDVWRAYDYLMEFNLGAAQQMAAVLYPRLLRRIAMSTQSG